MRFPTTFPKWRCCSSSSCPSSTRPSRRCPPLSVCPSSSEAIPGGVSSNYQLYKSCGSDQDPINSFANSINYVNYDTVVFSNPCGRLPKSFPDDSFVNLRSVDNLNTVFEIEATETTYNGNSQFFDSSVPLVFDERFVSWMVASSEAQLGPHFQQTLGKGQLSDSRRVLRPADQEQCPHQTLTLLRSTPRRLWWLCSTRTNSSHRKWSESTCACTRRQCCCCLPSSASFTSFSGERANRKRSKSDRKSEAKSTRN